MSTACPQIDGQRPTTFFVAGSFKVLQRSDVRICEIVNMNVVANAGAVRSRVVRSEDLQLGSFLAGGGKRQRNQMSLRIVQFANLAAVIGSRGVEIAQTDRAQSVSAAVSFERVFDKKLRGAIGIDGLTRRLLRNRNLLGDAVHGASGGKHKAADTGVHGAVQEAEC